MKNMREPSASKGSSFCTHAIELRFYFQSHVKLHDHHRVQKDHCCKNSEKLGKIIAAWQQREWDALKASLEPQWTPLGRSVEVDQRQDPEVVVWKQPLSPLFPGHCFQPSHYRNDWQTRGSEGKKEKSILCQIFVHSDSVAMDKRSHPNLPVLHLFATRYLVPV